MKKDACNVNLPVGGFIKQSLIDYPGYIASVLFTRGCNFRCRYCHNPELVWPMQFHMAEKHELSEILEWIYSNRKLLDALVFTGGEPTIHNAIIDVMKEIKEMGLKVKLDTNGTNPRMLSYLINEVLVDYVAMDIKAPLHLTRYTEITGECINQQTMKRVLRSISLLNAGRIDYEYRTTLDPSLTLEDIKDICNYITGKYFLQHLNTGEHRSDIEVNSMDHEMILKEFSGDRNQIKIAIR